jgi:thiaminase/transcriptional activator TenA
MAAESRTDRFRAASAWERATRHPFIDGMVDGTVDDATFQRYLEEDYAFVTALADAVAHLVAQAPTNDARRVLTGFLRTILGEEDAFFAGARGTAAPTAPTPTTRAFRDFLRASAAADGYGPRLAAVAAGEWVYLDWGRRVAANPPQDERRRRWTALHASEEFARVVGWMREELDRLALSSAEEDRAAGNFVQAVAYEAAFFDQFGPLLPTPPSATAIRVRPGGPSDRAACLAVAGRLPQYFSAAGLAAMEQHLERHRLWLADAADGEVAGFATVWAKAPGVVEITWMAVDPHQQGRGVGRAILAAALRTAAHEGGRLAVVKTLADTVDYEPYIKTRRFWERSGFLPVDVVDRYPGWDPGSSCAIYVRPLASPSGA